MVEGYVRERDLRGLNQQSKAMFYPDDPGLAPVPVQLARIEMTPAVSLARPSLAAVNGGEITTRQLPDGTLVPEEVYYRVFLKPVGKTSSLPQRTLRGVAMVRKRVLRNVDKREAVGELVHKRPMDFWICDRVQPIFE